MQQRSPKTHIKEIFASLQGEGPYVGEKHLFVRFCKCNLKCAFCDTDFSLSGAKSYTPYDLFYEIKDTDCKIISFTGGEPLLDTEFLIEFLSNYKSDKKIYLETNGTLVSELKKIINYVDIVAADIKIKSATGEDNKFNLNEEFLKVAVDNKKEVFAKVVFDDLITEDEITSIAKIASKLKILLILQPKMPLSAENNIIKTFDKFYEKYKNVRLIPQTHKFLNII